MFRIPSFGDEVISALWDDRLFFPAASSNPSTPRILLVHDYGGSTCSLFGGSSMRLVPEPPTDAHSTASDITSPATLEDLKAVEGDYTDSSFRITPEWLASVMHTCKLHPLVDSGCVARQSPVDASDDLLQEMLDWRPLDAAVLKFNEEHERPVNGTDFFLRGRATRA